MGHIQGVNRHEVIFFPERLDDYIAEDNPVRFLDAVVDELALVSLRLPTCRAGCDWATRLCPGRSLDALPLRLSLSPAFEASPGAGDTPHRRMAVAVAEAPA